MKNSFIALLKETLLQGDYSFNASDINPFASSLTTDEIIDSMMREDLVAFLRMILASSLKKMALNKNYGEFLLDFDSPPKMCILDCDVVWAKQDKLIILAFNPIAPVEHLQLALKYYFKLADDITYALKQSSFDPSKSEYLVTTVIPNQDVFKNKYAHHKMREGIEVLD